MARRVLFLHPSVSLYGADRQLHALAAGLDRRRYEPLVVLPEPGELASLLAAAGVETEFAAMTVLRRRPLAGGGVIRGVATRLAAQRRLGEIAVSHRAAIVHTNTSIVLGGREVAARAGAAHVVHVREIFDGIAGRLGRGLWPVLRRSVLRSDAVVCVSRAAGEQFGSGAAVTTIRDGVSAATPAPRAAAREALDVHAERFVIAVIGRVSDWKGQATFARALAEPPLADIGAIGVVVGDAAPDQQRYERELVDLRGRLRLGDRLRLLGFRHDVPVVLGAADAVAVPSTRADALPGAALESAAAAKPVVASATGGIPEIVRDGVTGLLVPPGDAAALAEALRALAEDPARGRRLGNAAAADVCARFPLQGMLDAVQECYDRICQRRASGRTRPVASR